MYDVFTTHSFYALNSSNKQYTVQIFVRNKLKFPTHLPGIAQFHNQLLMNAYMRSKTESSKQCNVHGNAFFNGFTVIYFPLKCS